MKRTLAIMRRGLAGSFILLILLPFTRPFPTCELSTILGGSHAAPTPAGDVTAVSDARAGHALPAVRYSRITIAPGPSFFESVVDDGGAGSHARSPHALIPPASARVRVLRI